MSAAAKIRVTLTEARVEEGSLRLAYEVANLTPEELGILDRVPVLTDFSKPPSLGPENAYLGVEGETLVVRKGIAPMPPGLRASEKTAPGTTRLAGGATRKEEIALALPVRAFDPNRAAHLRLTTAEAIDVVTAAPKTVTRVRLVVGYFVLGSAKLFPISPEHPEVFRVVPPNAPFATYGEAESELAATRAFEALEYAVVLEPHEKDGAGDDHGTHTP